MVLTPRMPMAQYGPRMLCEELPATVVFCPQYRLSSNPDRAFPAQLQDALASYHWLVHEQGVEPSRIIISGDSAGAHLALTLLRYLTQYPDAIAFPRAALLHSSWINLTRSGTDANRAPNAASDYLSTAILEWGVETFSAKDVPFDSECMSPLYHPFVVTVPCWVQVGTAEIFYQDIVERVRKMKTVKKTRLSCTTPLMLCMTSSPLVGSLIWRMWHAKGLGKRKNS